MKKFGYPMMINMKKIREFKDRLKHRHCFRAVRLNWGDVTCRGTFYLAVTFVVVIGGAVVLLASSR